MTENVEFEYPTSARRAFVNLAEAIRTSNEGHSMRDMLVAIAGLHMSEADRHVTLAAYLANIPHRTDFAPVHRQNLADALARLLEGRDKFDADRFIHHATSNVDGDEGKWSYNELRSEDEIDEEDETEESEDETIL